MRPRCMVHMLLDAHDEKSLLRVQTQLAGYEPADRR